MAITTNTNEIHTIMMDYFENYIQTNWKV
jgi:hypothetical protein